MTDRRTILIVFMGLLFGTSIVYAEMVPVCQLDLERQQPTHITDLQFTDSYDFQGDAGLDLRYIEFLPDESPDIGQTSGMQNPQILTDGTGSFSLCLSALIGLGMFSSARFVKKLSFGFIPEWYHNGGPFQIGHSHALPESLCPVPVCCFIQPVCTEEDSLIQYRLRTVVSLWRKSQFTPTVLVPRGPPAPDML